MSARTDDQVAIQRVLNRLRTTGGLEEEFENHHAVRSATIRIFRFLCEDQEWLDRVPAADGSNLEDYSVWMETYKWFKQWLSVCHYQTVRRGQLAMVHNDAAANLRLEMATHYLALIEGETKQAPVMQPFRKLYDQQSAALAAQWGNDPVPLMEADCEILGELMIAESIFEDALCGTHVEDVLLEKRFDRDQLDDGLRQNPLHEIRCIHECEREGWWIRQLRQHGFRRPWKQLYLVFEDGLNQEYAEHVANVANLFRDPRVERALDVQPIALSAMRDKNCAVMCGKHDDDEKDISADFGQGDTVMLQSCGQHWIHATCAFQAWDVLGQNKFSFPCPMCREDPGRLSSKLELDTEEDNFNVGFDPEKEQEDAFALIQEHLLDDYSLLERQHEFPAPARRKALREQRRLLDYAAEQDHYYYDILANWNTNPQNRNLRRPVHPCLREHHDADNFHLYDFDQDDDPPRYKETHWHDEALNLLNDGLHMSELPANLLRALRQWMERGGYAELGEVGDLLLDELNEVAFMEEAAGHEAGVADADAAFLDAQEAAFAVEHGAGDEDGGAGRISAEPPRLELPDLEMPDAGDEEDDWGMGAIQNAFARWRKVDPGNGTVGRRTSGRRGAVEVRAVRAVRRSPRLKRMVAARA